MKENMVMITSKSDSILVVNIPDLKFRRIWNKRGTRYPFDKDLIEQAMYYPDFSSLVNMGLLYIEDLEFKKEIGIEPQDATEPVNIIDVTGNLLKRMITVMPISELQSTLKKMSEPQRAEVGEYAVEHYQDLKMDRVDLLQKATGKNILKAIENKKSADASTVN